MTLLIALRYILIFWKNCSALMFFQYKSRRLRTYLVDLTALVTKLHIPRRTEKSHFIKFIVLYLLPFALIAVRVTFSALQIANYRPYRTVTFGFLRAPAWGKYTFYFFAEIIGGVLAVAVYVQISAFASVLIVCCKAVNKQIEVACDSAIPGSRFEKYAKSSRSTFVCKIAELRSLHEDLIQLCNQHEDLFSLQLLVGILDNSFIVFSTLASFFAPYLNTMSIGVYSFSIASFIYIMGLLPYFPIRLNEEVQ